MKYTPVSVLRFASFNAHSDNNVWFWWPLNGGEEDPKKRRSPPSLGFYAALNGLLTFSFGREFHFSLCNCKGEESEWVGMVGFVF